MQYTESISFRIKNYFSIVEAQISPDEQYLVFANHKKLTIYNLKTLDEKIKYFPDQIIMLEFSSNSKYLYVGLNSLIICFSAKNKYVQKCSFHYKYKLYGLQSSNLLICQSNTLKIINLNNKKAITRSYYLNQISCIASSEKVIALGFERGQISIYIPYDIKFDALIPQQQSQLDQIQIIQNQLVHIDACGNLVSWIIDSEGKRLIHNWIISSNDQCINFCYSFAYNYFCLIYQKQIKFYNKLQNLIDIQNINSQILNSDQCRIKQGFSLNLILLVYDSVLQMYQIHKEALQYK